MKKYFTFFYLTAACCFSATSLSAQAVDVNDSLALVDLYNSTGGPNWYNHTNWLQGPIRTWWGVTLTQDRTRVKQLFYLYGNNLDGVIPASLGNLTSCDFIRLESNHLRGSIPASLGNLTSIQYLWLDANQLTGEIPASLGLLPNLISLSVYWNHLSGKIPVTFVTTPNLINLDIHRNSFTFDGMEEIAQRHLQSFTYYDQAEIPVKRRNDTLYASVGGTPQNNIYKWQFNGNTVTKIGDSTLVPTETGQYYLRVTNLIANRLDLYSGLKEATTVAFLDPNFSNPTLVNPDGALSTNVVADSYYRTVSSAATDGATKVLIISRSSYPVTFTIAQGNDGMLSGLTDQNTFSKQVTINPVPSNYGRAIAIYTVPDGYGKSNQPDKFVDITAVANGDTIGHNKLRLIKTPVVLVHGMWSDPDIWEKGKFIKALSNTGFTNVFTADYSAAAATTFNPASPASLPGRTAVANATSEALAYYRNMGAAVTQVDVVGHSLGGLMTRSWSQQPNFKRTDNFQKGYIHKLITLGTPHRGSPLGPELVASQYNLVHLPFTTDTLPLIPLKSILALAGMPLGTCHPDFGINSPGITALSATPPYHTYSIVGDQTGQLLGFAGFFLFSEAALNHNYFDIFRAKTPCTNILEHDLVVPLSSQQGYITKSQTFNATGHSLPALTTETNSSFVQSKVINLLLSDSAAEFANGFPAPSTFPQDCTTASQRVESPLTSIPSPAARTTDTLPANSGIRITSPTRGISFRQGSRASVQLRYEKFGGARPGTCMFMVQGLNWYGITDSATNSTTFALPDSTPVGKLYVVLIGRDSSGAILGDTLNITIIPDGTLDSSAIEPNTIKLDSAVREHYVYLHGYYINTNGDTIKNTISSASSGTTYQAKTGNVFNVSKDGLVSAKAVGSDTLIVTHGSKIAKVRVVVDVNFNYITLYPNVIDFPQPSNVYIGDAPFALYAASSAGNDVTFTVLSGPATVLNGVLSIGNTVGTVTVRAASLGNSYFNTASTVTRTFNVSTGITYTFLGNGNWSNAANWKNNIIPPSTLPANSRIIVDPVIDGECVLDVIQRVSANNDIILKANKKIKLLSNLIINR